MSLYHIEEELLRIFAEIEANEGEISEELYAELNITKENLHQKLGNYVKAIKSWQGDVTVVKDEVKKLNANAKVKENKIERLKKAMLDAVLLFGNEGKTNKFVDLPTVKIFTKGSESTQTDDVRIATLIKGFAQFVSELVDSGVLYTGQDVDLSGVLDSINANLKAEHESDDESVINIDRGCEFIPYTLTDLTTLKIEITTSKSIYEFFRNGREALELYAKDPIHTEMRNHTAKEDWKTSIEIADKMNANLEEDGVIESIAVSYPTVAKIVKNQSIQFR